MNPKNFLSVPLMLMLLSGMPWSEVFASDDVKTTVEARSGEHKSVGNVTIADGEYGVVVEADNEGSVDRSGSVTVRGSVNLTNISGSEAYGVAVDANEGDATVDVSGNVTVNSKREAVGVAAFRQDDNKAIVKVGGDVSATSSAENSYDVGGVMLQSGEIDINGKVLAKSSSDVKGVVMYDGGKIVVGNGIAVDGEYAEGLTAYAMDKAVATIKKGGVSAEGKDPIGVMLLTGNQESADLSVTVGKGGVTANSTSTSATDGAVALGVSNLGGKINVDVTGDVVAKSKSVNAVGIGFGTFSEMGYYSDSSSQQTGSGNLFDDFWDSGASVSLNPTTGKNKVLIHGNLISDGVGIMANVTGYGPQTDVLVTEEIKAKQAGILLEKSNIPMIGSDAVVVEEGDSSDYNKLNLTVWKIKPNKDGNVAELSEVNGSYMPNIGGSVWGDPEGDGLVLDGVTRKAATDFEKNNILYIIKVEQPGAGATLKVLDENGNALEKSFGFDVAHEGDKILLKISVKKGYKLLAAYNGDGKKIPLKVDKNGDYYLIVPKGGGVYFSVKLKKLEDKKNKEESNNEENTYEGEQPDEEYAYVVNKASYNSDMPKTGDNNQLGAWMLVATASLGGIAGVEVYSKKKFSKKA